MRLAPPATHRLPQTNCFPGTCKHKHCVSMTNSTLLHRFFYGVPHHFIGRLVHIDRHRVNTPRESQRTHNLLIGRQSDEGGFRSEPRHCPSGSTRLGAAQDCRRSDISRCLTRCVSKRGGDPIFDRVPIATLVPTKSRRPAAVTGLAARRPRFSTSFQQR